MHDIWHLSDIDWLKELSPGELEALRRESLVRSYGEGEMIFAPTLTPESVYLLASGLARIYRLSESGAETTFGYVMPGEVFGELAAFGSEPRESFAQAVRPARVWRIPKRSFQRMLEGRASVLVAVTKQIGERLKRVESRVEHLVFRDVRSRVARMLLELTGDFGAREGDLLAIDLPLTQAELATLVGSTRQSVNATLRQLEAEGLIGRQEGQIVVFKADGLRRAAGMAPCSE